MRRLAILAALALSVLAGTARADSTWVVVPTASPASLVPASSDVAGVGGVLPQEWTSPPAVPVQLSYPQLLALWQRAGAAYGISWQVLAAINKVESNFGRNMGPSSAGAIGWMQFMPDTWLRWGTDGNGDGVADPWNPDDAVFSAARYLAASGGRDDIGGAIFSYNHADWYVREVLDYAQLFGNAGVDATFDLDRLQVALDRAQTNMAKASERLRAAQRDERNRLRRRDALLSRAQTATLLSRQIDLQRRAALADVAAQAAHRRVVRAGSALDAARADLERAREQSRAPAFAPAAGTMLEAATFGGGYVFPVGGGPSVVSVSHTHHDYPAADIAAPEGTPVYALASSVVVNAWAGEDSRCGIGFTLRAEDGHEWTYCHLSYRDPSVHDGAVLAAGALVGLVGMTGHASGPHLHLQLQPATAWPQRMPWFEHFAGTAFRWQDAPTPALEQHAAAAAPVFAPVPSASSDRVIAFTLN
jgi:murein DD-endopeptidase MepM/ murein hydrolase activator NlpD